MLSSSVRIPGSVGAAPVCLNEGLVGGEWCRNPKRRWGRSSAPNGSAPNGELFTEDSGATGGLGILEDHLWEPGFGPLETSGITDRPIEVGQQHTARPASILDPSGKWMTEMAAEPRSLSL